MSITIAHLVGPLAGQEQHFDDSVEVIIFGRSPECQVVYPPDCAEVGRKHFALRRNTAGDYLVVLFSDRFVAIDGIPVANGAVVRSGSGVRLGRAGGPSFRVKLGSEMADIAWSAEQDEPGDFRIEEKWETAVDLLVRRKSQAAAVITGIPADAGHHLDPEPPFPPPSSAPHTPPVRVGAAERPRGSFDPWFEDLLQGRHRSSPSGVGSGGAPHSRDRDEIAYSEIPATRAADERFKMSTPPRRSVAPLWWAAAAAIGAALIAYLFYRRETAVGSILGQLLHAAVPSLPVAKETTADLVDVSVFGPTAIKAGGEGLIQVFLHTLGQREIAKALAQETDPEATRRGAQTLAAEIAEGQRVEIMLDARGLGVDQEMQTLIWRSEPCACQFIVSPAASAAGRTFHPRVLVLVDSVPVGSLTFALKVTAEAASKTEPELRGDRARRYSYAFLSYASPDRAEVFKRAQGLKAGGTSFFNDLLSLEPGERWERRLYQEIDRCDVFYLFWSSKAKDSEWVMKETEYALARRAASANGDPDIIPIIIEGPPSATPPESLKDIHFNDSLLYVLAGIAGGSSVDRN